jgi:hypothetical protein
MEKGDMVRVADERHKHYGKAGVIICCSKSDQIRNTRFIIDFGDDIDSVMDIYLEATR